MHSAMESDQGGSSAAPSIESQFNECLKLLEGPTDERRFVGLLLVTKLLPHGDPAAIRRVYNAVGPSFLTRLLLALKDSYLPTITKDPDTLNKQAGTAALGLAVLATFTQIPDIAASSELLDKLPLFLKVVKMGGVMAALAGPSAPADPATELASVRDALECSLAVVASSEQGRRVAAESRALNRVVCALERWPGEEHHQVKELAVKLAGVVMGYSLEDHDQHYKLFEDHEGDIQKLVTLLSKLFAAPALLQQNSVANQQPQTTAPNQQLNSPRGAAAMTQQRRQQAATLQLETLSVLLLIFPIPRAKSPTLHLALASGASNPRCTWSKDIRAGISLLLRSRTAAAQRHGALQLAAEMVDLGGPSWLLGPGYPATGAQDGTFYQLVTEITRVETGVLLLDALAPTVPVPSAAHPGISAAEWNQSHQKPHHNNASPSEVEQPFHQHVFETAGSGTAADIATTSKAPEFALEEEGDDMDIGGDDENDDGGGEYNEAAHPDLEGLRRAIASGGKEGVPVDGSDGDVGVVGQRPPDPGETQRRVDAVELPQDMNWKGPSESSGDRALRMLPICFTLLESEIDILAEDAERAESLASGHLPAPTDTYVPPALPESVVSRALASTHEATEVVVQYLEQVSKLDLNELSQNVNQHTSDTRLSFENSHWAAMHPVIVAAIRVVCRFCAEAPDAFGPRLRPLTPWIIKLTLLPGISGGNISTNTTTVPGSTQGANSASTSVATTSTTYSTATTTGTTATTGTVNTAGVSSPGSGGLAFDDERQQPERYMVGVLFMLPMLLQVTDPEWSGAMSGGIEALKTSRGQEQKEWLSVLGQPEVVKVLVVYAKHVLQGVITAVTQSTEDAYHSKAAAVCELLLRVVQGLRDVLAPQATSKNQTSPRSPPKGSANNVESAALLLGMIKRLSKGLHQLIEVGNSSFNRRIATTKQQRINTNRAVACCSALLSQLWLLALDYKATEPFAKGVSAIYEALLSGLHLTTMALNSTPPSHPKFDELAELTEILLRDLTALSKRSQSFKDACLRSKSLELALKKGELVQDDDLQVLLQEFKHLHH